jgi:hypothetical protein
MKIWFPEGAGERISRWKRMLGGVHTNWLLWTLRIAAAGADVD